MIYFIIGTKAQLIKMFPLMRCLSDLNVPFRYIDTMQHGSLCKALRQRLQLADPDFCMAPQGTQIETLGKAVKWAVAITLKGIWQRRQVFPQKGVILVHGDTLSTLLGLILGRCCGQKVCHVEAGERTHKLFRPFPEEIIRRIVDRFSDLLLACGDRQLENIKTAGITKTAINLRLNTLVDAVLAVAEKGKIQSTDGFEVGGTRHIQISIHRYETITSRVRMTFFVEAVEMLAKENNLAMGLHPPTRNKLIEFGLIERLERIQNMKLGDLYEYPDFIQALNTSKYLITDGGGPQEESYFLGVPCLLLRSETERTHSNVYMGNWDLGRVQWFDKNYSQFRHKPIAIDFSPSQTAAEAIVEHFTQFSRTSACT